MCFVVEIKEGDGEERCSLIQTSRASWPTLFKPIKM